MGGFFFRLLYNVYFISRSSFAGAILLEVSGKTQLGSVDFGRDSNPAVGFSHFLHGRQDLRPRPGE